VLFVEIKKSSVAAFWVAITCGLVGGYQCFAEMYRSHLQDAEYTNSLFLFKLVLCDSEILGFQDDENFDYDHLGCDIM
jgi:hypothetical protein